MDPSYEDYIACVPPENKKWLEEEVDFQTPGIDKHLVKIAAVVNNWENLANELDLTRVDIGSINYERDLDKQKIKALQKWHGKRGFHATYEKLLKACVECGEHEAAKKILELLGAKEKPKVGKSRETSQQHHEQSLTTTNIEGAGPLNVSSSKPPINKAQHILEKVLWSDCNYGAPFVQMQKPQFTRTLLELNDVLKEFGQVDALDLVTLLGQGIQLAVLENGCYSSNHSLNSIDNLVQKPFDYVYSDSTMGIIHGTTVTGIASGRPFLGVSRMSNNTMEYPGGVAPGAEVKLYMVDEHFSYKSLYDVLNVILQLGTYDVVSLSFRTGRVTPAEHEQMRLLIEALESRGTYVFAAAGNEGDREEVEFPACVDKVISVGSLNYFAKYSEHTKETGVDVYCFGEVIAPHVEINALTFVTGSSFATPAVAGLACLAFQYARIKGFFGLDHKRTIISKFSGGIKIKSSSFLRSVFATIDGFTSN